jgi:hypothetical protein
MNLELVVEAIDRIGTINRHIREACIRDVLLLEGFLWLDDHRQLYRLARATRYATPSDQDLLPVVAKLQRYCSDLVRRRMRFLIKHDRGLTAQDLENGLFEAGLMTLRQYDSETNQLKLLNTAKRGAHNYFVRLVEFYTAQCRSRLVRHIAGETVPYRQRRCGTCAWFDVAAPDGKTCEQAGIKPSHEPCRRKGVNNLYHVRTISECYQCGNCLHYDQAGAVSQKRSCMARNVKPTERPCGLFELRIGVEQFVSTTASLDAPTGDQQTGERASLIEFIPDKKVKEPESNELLRELMEALPPREARVIRITIGLPDEGFDSWLWRRTSRFSCEFNDSQLARYGCEFLGVDIEDMRAVLRQHLPLKDRSEARPSR